ncbi:MAG: alkaline phosphatase family protein [Ginsengibacter sp.]
MRIVSLLLVICFLFPGKSLLSQVIKKKTIFIILDGIPADVIEKADLPNLKAISTAGGYSRAFVGGEREGYSQTPTISAVGYNSVLTGTWANKHNVWDNDIKDPNYNYPTIFRLLKEQYPAKKIAIFSSWQDNRTKLAGEGIATAGNIHFDYHLDGLELDTLRFPHDKDDDFMHFIDRKIADEAAQSVLTFAPDLTWVYLQYTDDMAHRFGDSPEFYNAVAMADEEVGGIWRSILLREQNYNEDWLVIVTTDHGRDAKTGKGHGGQSDRERAGWIFTNASNTNVRFKENKSAIVDIMPTIARFMNIGVAPDVAREIDGVPLIGDLSLTDLSVDVKNAKAIVKWTPIDKTGVAKIYLSSSNDFQKGINDNYQLMKKVHLKTGSATIDLPGYPSAFYKIVLEGKWNSLNRWIVTKDKD